MYVMLSVQRMEVIWLGDMTRSHPVMTLPLALQFTIVLSLHISVVGLLATGSSAGEED